MAQLARRSPLVASSHHEEEQLLIPKATKTKGKAVVAVISLSNLCAWSCISLIAPFFPIVAEEKGMNDTIIGIMYSCPELVIFLTSPIFAKLLSQNSPRFFYIAGLFVFGCCDVMYGWVDQSPPGIPFISICFAVRIVGSVGTASLMTASFAIAGNYYPEKIGTVYAILETVSGVGFLIGPAVGGALYQLGGFGLPFWVFGVLVFICGIASFFVLPELEYVEKESASPSSLTLLRNQTVLFGSTCLMFGMIGFAVWEPVFTQYLEQFSLSQSVIGLIFVIPAATYSFTTPIWGWIIDKNVPPAPMMIVGLICGSVCFLFFGPAPFFTFLSPMLWLTIVTIALLGFALAPVVVGAMRCIVEGAREIGFKDDGSTFGLVGGIVQSSNCLGTFAGPLIGGALTDKFGFGWTMTLSAFLLLIPVVCFSPFLILAARRRNRVNPRTCERSYVVLKGEYMKTSISHQSSL